MLYSYSVRSGIAVQVVVLSQVLACDATLGYEDYCNVQVLKFNSTPVRNLGHLIQLVANCTEHYMRFDLAYKVCTSLCTCAFAMTTMQQYPQSMYSGDVYTVHDQARSQAFLCVHKATVCAMKLMSLYKGVSYNSNSNIQSCPGGLCLNMQW